MSDNRGRLMGKAVMARLFFAAMIIFFLAESDLARAYDLTGTLRSAIDDPLRVRPDALDKGVVLPGDAAPVRCGATLLSAPLALSDAVDLALCNNAQIKAAWAAIKIQAAAVGEARAAYLPTLSVTANRLRTRTVYTDPRLTSPQIFGDTLYGALNWRLFDFGTREANRRSANNLLLAAFATHDAMLQKSLAATISAYFDVQSARALWLAKEQSQAIAQDTLDSARRREAKGAVARSDTLQAATALARATLENNRAFSGYHKSLAVLIYAMGLPADSKIVLAEEPEQETRSVKGNSDSETPEENLDIWLHEAQKLHPAIRAARAQWMAASDRIMSVRAEGLPTIDVAANYYKNGYPGQGLSANNSHINTVGISITFPLFDGFSHKYKVRGAQAQAEQLEQELADTEHNVLMDVVKIHSDAIASLQNLQASKNLLDVAQDALNTSKRKYEKGATDILEVLSTQSAFVDAAQERIVCLSEWRSARLRLMASSGTLGQFSVVSGQDGSDTLPAHTGISAKLPSAASAFAVPENHLTVGKQGH